jgi:pilus assembly protein CpaB
VNRNTRLLMVIGIALVTATLAAAAIYISIHRPGPPPLTVVVAARPLEIGVGLKKEDVKLVVWPVTSPITGRFEHIEDVVDRGLLIAINENEPITESRLAPRGYVPPAKIPPGKLAMSVKVNEVIGVAGFVVPGSHVDVIVTMRQEKGAVSRVVVRDVRVLTAGAKYDEAEANRQGKPIPSTVVTLLVNPEQAQEIALGASEGQLTLALRNQQDPEGALIGATTTDDLFRMEGAPPPASEDPGPGRVSPPPPPVIASITSPADGATLTGKVGLSATASGKFASVQWKVDDINLGAEVTERPYASSWDTMTAATGAHTVTVSALDAAGRPMSVATVLVNVCWVETVKNGKRERIPCS